MSAFLARLARRQIEPEPALLPRSVSRFAPADPRAGVMDAEVESTIVPRRHRVGQSSDEVGDAGHVGADTERAGAPAVARQKAPAAAPAVALPVSQRQVSRESPERASREKGVNVHQPMAETHDAASMKGIDEATSHGDDDPRRNTSAASDDGAWPRYLPLVPREVAAARRATERAASDRTATTQITAVGRGVQASVARAARDARSEGREEPVVHITIGRVEVRAMVQPPTVREDRAAPRPGTLSLEQYLDQRHGARR